MTFKKHLFPAVNSSSYELFLSAFTAQTSRFLASGKLCKNAFGDAVFSRVAALDVCVERSTAGLTWVATRDLTLTN